MLLSEIAPFALTLLVVAFLLVVVHRIRRIHLIASERAWRPSELKDSELVYMERVFRTRWPIRLVARVDRGYRTPDGVITLVELKTRRANRVYLSDIIELSAQRFAVQTQTGRPVADYGYVLIQRCNGGAKIPHRVILLSAEQVTAVAKRRRAILAGEATPRCTRVEGLCTRCAFEHECPGAGNVVTYTIQ